MSYLIDYLVEESLSDFSVLIGKRKLLIQSCVGEGKEETYGVQGLYELCLWTIPQESEEEKREDEKWRKEHTKANIPQRSKHSIFLLIKFIHSLSTFEYKNME